jgi:hypothetical protein
MRRRVLSLVMAGVMVLGMTGCGNTGSDSSAGNRQEARLSEQQEKEEKNGGSSASSSGYNPYPDGPSIRTSFTDYAAETNYEIVENPSVEGYQINEDFSNVSNASRYSYLLENEEFKNKLLENGFVVVSGGEDEFWNLYEENRYQYLANFVTTDSILHTYHLYFAYLLKNLEKTYFSDNMKTVTEIMIDEAKSQYDELSGTEWENAAKRNLAFFSVAAKIFDPEAEVDPLVADVVNEELALIDAAGGITDSPVMNMGVSNSETSYQEDYSQYKVRGYYTESEQLSAYFKATMWFGRMSFRVSSDDETRSAILMTKAMENEEALSNWSNVYDVTSFFVGNSDDPGIYDYYPVVESVYPDMNVSSLVGDTEKWDEVKSALASLEAPTINSIPIDAGMDEEEKSAAINSFRFMGQRETFDAAAFQQLVESNVKERYLPSAMDIPAVLGSEEAENILKEEGAFDYTNYGENLSKLQENVADTDSDVWKSTLYSSWINTLRPLTEEKGEGYPTFMQNTAWTRKQLNTFLGSYTELKHDTILYAKQVYAEMGGGDEIEEIDFRGYVEPESEVYARVAELSAMTRDGLQGYGMISDDDAEMLTLLQQLAEQLLTISNKELSNESLTDDEHELIKTYGGQLEHLWQEAMKDEAGENGYLTTREHPAALVADIATDPNGSCLEVGTGSVDKIYVVVNVEGSLRIATGTVYSYYEFEQPLAERLTDQEWRIMLGIDLATDENGNFIYNSEREDVEQPSWVYEFKMPKSN